MIVGSRHSGSISSLCWQNESSATQYAADTKTLTQTPTQHSQSPDVMVHLLCPSLATSFAAEPTHDRLARPCLSLSHHHSCFLGRNIFTLRQLFIIVPSDEPGQVAAVLEQRPCWEGFQRRQRGEPGEETVISENQKPLIMLRNSL